MSHERQPDYPWLVQGRRWLERLLIFLGLGLTLLLLVLGIAATLV